ncbi:DUF6958 family protein [Pseudochryseolinea flava]|uniref:Uncharacterized protein n=1 Tax=Pseudochryseolinea flava TaxID=2059302 RepID=A0A364Y1W7_9BACT|nr:hypothetical protein [Pseudochryseolinea flava]RAW00630.1 hypothetical protein DQQ10_13640 [Pseudochryseolinea flava]
MTATTILYDKVIFTKHPEGKKGACISKDDYVQLRESILTVLEQTDRITLPELIDIIQRNLPLDGHANIAWRILVVKLDLEAKGLIRSVPNRLDRYMVHLKLNRRELRRLKAA